MDPPPAVLETIAKTVAYVAKNGASFEERLRANALDKFAFLDCASPWHAVYRQQLEAARQHTAADAVDAAESAAADSAAAEEPAPPPLRFVTPLPPISSLDLDVIKVTAMFVARNGAHYAERLRQRPGAAAAAAAAQFEFLRRGHSLHALYQALVRQYELVLAFDIDLEAAAEVLPRAYQRARHAKLHRARAVDERRAQRAAQMAYASIDWQDFAVVGSVHFDAVDEVKELAVPLKRGDVEARALAGRRGELAMEVAPAAPGTAAQPEAASAASGAPLGALKVNAADSGSAGGAAAAPGAPPGAPRGIKIKPAGQTRLKRRAPTTIVCPLTSQPIPELQFDAHLRALLRDPRYQQQQENYMRKNFAYASNLLTDEVYDNIKRLARKRPHQ